MNITYMEERYRTSRMASNPNFPKTASPPQQKNDAVPSEGRPRSSASLHFTGGHKVVRHLDDKYQFAQDVARFYGIDSFLCQPAGGKPSEEPVQSQAKTTVILDDKKAYNYNIINLHDLDGGQVYQYLVPVSYNPNILNLNTTEPGNFSNVENRGKPDPELFEIPQANNPSYYCSNCEICTNLRNQQYNYPTQQAPKEYLRKNNSLNERIFDNLGYYEMSPNIRALNLKTLDTPPTKISHSSADAIAHNTIKALNLRSTEACHNGYFERPAPRIIGSRSFRKNSPYSAQEAIFDPKQMYVDQGGIAYGNYNLAYPDKVENPQVQRHCYVASNKDNPEGLKLIEPCHPQSEASEQSKGIHFVESQTMPGFQQAQIIRSARIANGKRYHSSMFIPQEPNLIQDYFIKDYQGNEIERNFVSGEEEVHEEMQGYDHLYTTQEQRPYQPISAPRGYFVHMPKIERASSKQMYSMKEPPEYQEVPTFPIGARYKFKSYNQIETEYANRFVPEPQAAEAVVNPTMLARDRKGKSKIAISKSSECIIITQNPKSFQISRGIQQTPSMLEPCHHLQFIKNDVAQMPQAEAAQGELVNSSDSKHSAEKWQEQAMPSEGVPNEGPKEKPAEVGNQLPPEPEKPPIQESLSFHPQSVKMLRLQAFLPHPMPILVKPPRNVSGLRPGVNQGGVFHAVGDRFA